MSTVNEACSASAADPGEALSRVMARKPAPSTADVAWLVGFLRPYNAGELPPAREVSTMADRLMRTALLVRQGDIVAAAMSHELALRERAYANTRTASLLTRFLASVTDPVESEDDDGEGLDAAASAELQAILARLDTARRLAGPHYVVDAVRWYLLALAYRDDLAHQAAWLQLCAEPAVESRRIAVLVAQRAGLRAAPAKASMQLPGKPGRTSSTSGKGTTRKDAP